MSNTVEKYTYRGIEIEISQDEFADSPAEWEYSEVFLAYAHRQFSVLSFGLRAQDLSDFVDVVRDAKRQTVIWKGLQYFIIPVFAYIHSGVSLSLSRGTERWDTSMCGFAFIERKKGVAWTIAQAKKRAEGLIETWNQYLSGEVYGYSSEVGGCCGYYGSDFSYMKRDAEAEIDGYIQRAFKKHARRVKAWSKHSVPLQYRKPFKYTK